MTLKCPRCKQVLAPVEIEDAGITTLALRCVGCSGHFFERGKLEPIVDVVKVKLFEHRHIPSTRTQLSPISCPVCGDDEPMLKVASHRDQKVVTDVCPRCRGTWLDPGELEAIQEEGLVTFLGHLLQWLG